MSNKNKDAYPDTWGVAAGGEFYHDLLTIDSMINQRSIRQQASSLLCAKLQEREPRIRACVEYLAKKRGISFDAMWRNLADGSYEPLGPGEWADQAEGES